MSPPVSRVGECFFAGTIAFAGVGEDARAMDSSLSDFRKEIFADSVSLAAPKAVALDELTALIAECENPNWDGYGALALSQMVLDKAHMFIDALPGRLANFELSATPEGDIAFDWFYAKRHSLTVLLGEQTRLVYAVIDGDDEFSGTATFVEEVPRSISDVLNRLSSYSAS